MSDCHIVRRDATLIYCFIWVNHIAAERTTVRAHRNGAWNQPCGTQLRRGTVASTGGACAAAANLWQTPHPKRRLKEKEVSCARRRFISAWRPCSVCLPAQIRMTPASARSEVLPSGPEPVRSLAASPAVDAAQASARSPGPLSARSAGQRPRQHPRRQVHIRRHRQGITRRRPRAMHRRHRHRQTGIRRRKEGVLF
jgi:hypothetical protein